MDYYFSRILPCSMTEAETSVLAAMKERGFGLITEIDMKQKLNEKLGVEIRPYKILGMCNPAFAYKALQAEEKIGTMLPCNVLLIDKGDGTTEVAAVNPIASMQSIRNEQLGGYAQEVTNILKEVVEGLS
jgi:uncharacterized protein (DUF302 family)